MDYKEKDVVWVKLRTYPWWPAQVTNEELPTTNYGKKSQEVNIKFFNENFVETITSSTKIKAFNCPEKDSFIKNGFSLKSEEKKKLFIQALKMASDMSERSSENLLSLNNHSEETSVKDQKNYQTNTEGLKSYNRQNNQNNIDSDNIYNRDHGIENDANVQNLANCISKDKKREWKHQHNGLDNGIELPKVESDSLHENYTDLCSNSNDSSSDGSCLQYRAFKSLKLQRIVDWNKSPTEDANDDQNVNGKNNKTENEDKSIIAASAEKATHLNAVTSKKRKLAFDENCNNKTKQTRKTINSDLPVLTRTSTPKCVKNNPKAKTISLPNLNIIKTFTKLSQKTKEKEKEKVKLKRGRPPKSRQIIEQSNAIMESESAKTPKSLKWEDSFELPTPGFSQCSSFLTSSSFDPNLDKDTCDSSSDSDTELPEGLSPIVGDFPICEKDIVWLKWKKFPAWPAFVRHIYRKKRRIHKLSVAFIEGNSDMPKRLRVTYKSKTIVPFVDKQKDQFKMEGENIQDPVMKRKFIEACEIAENFLHKKALVSLNREEFSFFGESDEEEEVESDTNESSQPVNHESTMSDVEKRLSDSDSESDYYHTPQTAEPSVKELERLRKMTAKQENLVNYIKSEEMKKYLLDIFYKRKNSTRHHAYFHGTIKEKNGLRYAGFGPIYNEEQEEEIVDTTKKWLYELPKKDVPDISYILDVWIPEAVVYALIKVKGYSRKKAWLQFEKGVSMTKVEKERQHQSMMEFIGYTEEEKQEVREKAQQRMATFKYQHGLA